MNENTRYTFARATRDLKARDNALSVRVQDILAGDPYTVVPLVGVLVSFVLVVDHVLATVALKDRKGRPRVVHFTGHGVQLVRPGEGGPQWFRLDPATLAAARVHFDSARDVLRDAGTHLGFWESSGLDTWGPDLHSPWCPQAGRPMSRDAAPGLVPASCGLCRARKAGSGTKPGNPLEREHWPDTPGVACPHVAGWSTPGAGEPAGDYIHGVPCCFPHTPGDDQ